MPYVQVSRNTPNHKIYIQQEMYLLSNIQGIFFDVVVRAESIGHIEILPLRINNYM